MIDDTTRAEAKVPRAKIQWTEGSIFLVPLSDGLCSVGQVLKRTPDALNSVVCAFYDLRVKPKTPVDVEQLTEESLISIQFTTHDLLRSGTWVVVGQGPSMYLERMTRLPSLERAGYVGAVVVGSRNMTLFLEAFHGLRPWDDYADPAYFEKLLLSPDKKPA